MNTTAINNSNDCGVLYIIQFITTLQQTERLPHEALCPVISMILLLVELLVVVPDL